MNARSDSSKKTMLNGSEGRKRNAKSRNVEESSMMQLITKSTARPTPATTRKIMARGTSISKASGSSLFQMLRVSCGQVDA